MLPLLLLLIVVVGVAVSAQQAQMIPIPLGSQISARDTASLWPSPDGSFAFGFLPDRPAGDAFVAAVFHNLPGAPRPDPVWAAGGGVRVSENSTLLLSPAGSLLLLDSSRSPLPLWSSDTDGLGVRCAALTDAGNLVLLANGTAAVWESFASPTDTLLPGQPLRYPRSLRAASANSIASYYSLAVTSSGEIRLLWEDNVTYWSSSCEAAGAAASSEARLDSDGMFALVDRNGTTPWFRLSKDFRDPDVRFRRLRIDPDGNLRIYSWDRAASAWRVGWQAVQDQCRVFASCGLYSVCGYGPGGPYCGCLNQDSAGDAAAACEKMADLGNCQKGFSMVDLQQTFLYSLYPPHDLDVMLGAEDCRSYCYNDTGCFAATARNDGSGVCTVKRTSFVSGYGYPSVQAVSFVKVCLVPQAVSAQLANVHGNSRLPPAEEQQRPVAETVGGWRSYRVTIVVLLLITGFVFLTVEMAVFWFILYKRRRLGAVERRRRIPFGKDVGMNVHYSALVRLSLGEVEELTKNFGTKLGPNVYKGVLPNKIMVTVKVLVDVVASERDFHLVASTLGSTHHRNLVALKGFCYETSRKLLVYEYVTNGSLDEWLRKQNKRDGWRQRLNIAIGIARGLAYLHLECKQCISHGNLKLENVLLDDYLVPKLTNFGLQSLLKQDAASPSETLPERDVFKFGSILLQIVSGKLDVSVKEQCCLAYEVCKNGGFSDFVDAQLKGKVEVEDVQRVVRLALWCMQDQPNIRPSIGEVVMVLEGALSLDMPPIPEAHEMVANQNGDQDLDIVEILESG